MAEETDLDRFNRAVSHWSNQFSPDLRDVAFTVGSRMGPGHSEFMISWGRLLFHHDKLCPPVSKSTLRKRCRIWSDTGGLKMRQDWRETSAGRIDKEDPDRLDKSGKRRVGARGGARANSETYTFAVDFSVVVKSRRVFTGRQGRPVTEYYTEPWEFGTMAPEHDESRADRRERTIATPAIDGLLTGNTPAIDPYSSLTFFDTSLSTSSTTNDSGGGPDVPEESSRGDDGAQQDVIPRECPRHHASGEVIDGCEGCVQETVQDLIEVADKAYNEVTEQGDSHASLGLDQELVEEFVREHGPGSVEDAMTWLEEQTGRNTYAWIREQVYEVLTAKNPPATFMWRLRREVGRYRKAAA